MSLKNGETEYKLKSTFQYTAKGQFQEAEFFVLKEPRIQHAQQALKLKQIIQQSELQVMSNIKKLGLLDDSEDQLGLKAGEQSKPIETIAEQWENNAQAVVEQVEMQLTQSNIDMYDFANIFWKMAEKSPSICLIDGQIPMKSGFKDNLSLDDFIGVPLWYCSFFVTRSASIKNHTSDEQPTSV